MCLLLCIASARSSSASQAKSAVTDSSHASQISEQESIQELRLFNRTPCDPYVRSHLISREYEKKEKQQESLWNSCFDRVERIRARDRSRYDVDKSNDRGDSFNTAEISTDVSASNRPTTIFTRPSTVASGVQVLDALGHRSTYGSSAGGGHHMYSRSTMRDLICTLPNPSMPITDFVEYEQLQVANDDKHAAREVTFGRDFLGASRIIDPKFSRASSALGHVGEPKWLPFTIRRAETTCKLDARPSPLTGRKIADFAGGSEVLVGAVQACAECVTNLQSEERRGPVALLRSERRLQAAMDGSSFAKASRICFINDGKNATGILNSILPVYKNIQLRGKGRLL